MNKIGFEYVAKLTGDMSGIVIKPGQSYLVENRLSPLVRDLGMGSIDELIEQARSASKPEIRAMIVDAMTTKETMFYRDRSPFEHLRKIVFPALKRNGAQIRIWSAACSTGQEAYSIAMMLDQEPELLGGADVEIVATDLSAMALKQAREGLYSQFEVQRGLPLRLLMEYFVQDGSRWRISDVIREKVTFAQHNLMDSPVHLGRFDIVLCRNVLTYFDKEGKKKVLAYIAPQMLPGGYLFLGGAEPAFHLTNIFREIPEAGGVYKRNVATLVAGGAAA